MKANIIKIRVKEYVSKGKDIEQFSNTQLTDSADHGSPNRLCFSQVNNINLPIKP